MTRHPLALAWSRAGATIAAAGTAFLLAACVAAPGGESPTPTATPEPATTPTDSAEVQAIRDAIERTIDEHDVRAAIVRVMRGDEVIITQAWGESMAGVPATVDMHFRSGSVAIPQVSTVLLQLVDEGVVSVDDPLATWLPEIPHADEVTLGDLARMTSGYVDYVHTNAFIEAFYEDPFRTWSPEELQRFGTEQPLWFEPGTNWSYAHTNYVLLGLALEAITGRPLDVEIQERILDPLGMTQTADPGTPEITDPALHAFTSERKSFLGVPTGAAFTEDATYWNPSWTLGRGSIQISDIADMATVIRAIGRGDLLSEQSHDLQLSPELRGRTTAIDGCGTCRAMDDAFTYGYGVVLSGDWVLQTPMFAGIGGATAYLPSEDLTIAVAASYGEGAFDADGTPAPNLAGPLYAAIAGVVAPDAATRWGVPRG